MSEQFLNNLKVALSNYESDIFCYVRKEGVIDAWLIINKERLNEKLYDMFGVKHYASFLRLLSKNKFTRRKGTQVWEHSSFASEYLSDVAVNKRKREKIEQGVSEQRTSAKRRQTDIEQRASAKHHQWALGESKYESGLLRRPLFGQSHGNDRLMQRMYHVERIQSEVLCRFEEHTNVMQALLARIEALEKAQKMSFSFGNSFGNGMSLFDLNKSNE